ncbi:MAG: DUF4118 domain-containing protein [Phenylobacterium sp.]|uniref:HWE histidine kinase domain-containing protein n=1 Tax=Phenylobacterium sp. TaxID=1871053 RepID=UPI0011F72A6C|nr:HWE histidine kinase domain-containing protein [Phenylobacterium sp.]TAL32570.1 MAG: DUF4118 domain-containing protein [Phenylobacterium sp.]
MPILARLQDAVTRSRPGFVSSAFGVGVGVAVPTLMRMGLDPWLGMTLWFPTYYPAALLGTLFLGWRSGVGLVLLSAIAANYFFVPPRYQLAGHERDLAGTLVFLVAAGIIVLAAALLRTALVRLQAAHERERILNTELQHRMKNTLAVVQGLVAQTVKGGAPDPKAFQHILQGRLEALGHAHDLLSIGHWETCELAQLAERTLAPFRDHGGLRVAGPSCTLRAESCVPLVLALHELATNAVKYGALSVERGRVDLTWSPADGVGPEVLLRWVERDGPTVVESSRRGLGTRLLRRQPGLEDVQLHHKPEGVVCEITVRPVDAP